MYLRNTWYVAAWAQELRDNLLSRRIINEPLLLYRPKNGDPAALSDRCPHRFAPLSRGRQRGDNIQCGYHGLTFDMRGQCIGNPMGGGEIPPHASVRSYPAAERHGLIWIWPGDREKADTTNIPDLSIFDQGRAVGFGEGYLHVRADYQLAIDNLMDLSHAAILHEETLGQATPGLKDGTLRVSQSGGRVMASFEMLNILAADGQRYNQWLETEWSAPGVIILTLEQTPARQPRKSEPVRALHIVTPETDSSSHYFFGSSVLEQKSAYVRDPFADEDEPMLAACE